MLNEPDARVYEVAVKLGYHDGRYFSQLFKRCTGMTPKSSKKDAINTNKENKI